MLYTAYEIGQTALTPLRLGAGLGRHFWQSPLNPVAGSKFGRVAAASMEFLENTTRRFGKPDWDIDKIMIGGEPVPVTVETVMEKDFGNLLHFRRCPETLAAIRDKDAEPDPRVLIVAPMSGHFATLLRGTVMAMLPDHEVYITDWADARHIPASWGKFDLNDYINYLISFMRQIGPKAHTLAVCQPGPGLLAAIAVMSEHKDAALPSSMTFMGSPIDARKSPTVTNILAEKRDLDWFEKHMIQTVPAPYAGLGRRVYPGFLQLYSFMSMNSHRHTQAHYDYFQHLVEGDGDSVGKHRKFYDEYLSVADMPAEFYLQTIDEVFQRYTLANGEFLHEGERVKPEAIKKVALMTVEGELDDISGIGQTQAAHDICVNIPADKQLDYIQKGVGHYGVFNGSRWRTEIQPRLAAFIRENHDAKFEKKFAADKA